MDENYYQNVLIADDTKDEISNLQKYLQDHSIKVEYASDPNEAFEIIANKQIDLLILDWFFVLPQSPDLAVEVVHNLIENNYLIPIFIYCNNERSKDEIDEIFPKEYPRVLINYLRKQNPSNPQGVKEFIDKWFDENPSIGFGKTLYTSIQNATGKTLQEIYKRLEDGVINLLGQTYKTSNDNGAEDIINLMVTVLQEYILKENKLIEDIDNIIRKVSSSSKTQPYNYEALRSFEMYSNVSSNCSISTGDIFLLDTEMLLSEEICSGCLSNKKGPVFAVAISAECDYARSQSNLRYHKLLLGKSLLDLCYELKVKTKDLMSFISELSNHNKECYYYLPFVQSKDEFGENYNSIVLDFQNVITIKSFNFDDYLVKKRIYRLRPVYIQHLIRRYSSYSSRIGVPEIPKQKRKEIADRIGNQLASKLKEEVCLNS